jgi:2'-5' RNA ligase
MEVRVGVFQTLASAVSGSAFRSAFRRAPVVRATPPAAPARLGKNGPPAGMLINAPRHYSPMVRQLALDADPSKVTAIYNRADYGDTPDLMDLYDGARGLDSRLSFCASKRVLAVQRCKMVFEPPPDQADDKEAAYVAADVTRLLTVESRHFRREVGSLAHAPLNGYAVAEKVWRQNRDGEWVPDLKWRHPNRFAWLDEETIAWCESGYRTMASGASVPLRNYPDKFVVHAPTAGNASYPWRRGAFRPLMLLSLSKRHDIRWWVQLIEQFGKPQLWAETPDNVDDDGSSSSGVVQKIIASLQALNEDWAAVFGRGVKVNAITKSGEVNGDLHRGFAEWCNTEIAIGTLGQNLTTEVQGGSLAATTAHRFVADDILEADGVELDETITQQVVEDVVRYNWPGAPVPRARLVTEREAEWTVDDVKEGICTPDEYRARKGGSALPDGKGAELRRPLSLQVPAGFPIAGLPAPTAAPLALPAPKPTDGVEAGDVIDVDAAPDQAVAKDPTASLNGAQVTALLGIVEKVAAGLLPRETGIQSIVASFPISEAQAEKIMGSVGAGFVPKPQGEAEATFAAARAPTHDGVMIAAYPSAELAAKLAIPGGEPAAELHVTLAYLGKQDELEPATIEAVASALETFAREHAPLDGVVGGLGRFSGSKTSDAQDVLYGSVDVPGLSRMRTELVAAIESIAPARQDHDFSPHITLAYLEPGSALPVQSLDPEDLRIDALELVVGGERRRFPLGSGPASGGTPPERPFEGAKTTASTPTTSETSARSTHPLARALSRR